MYVSGLYSNVQCKLLRDMFNDCLCSLVTNTTFVLTSCIILTPSLLDEQVVHLSVSLWRLEEKTILSD